MGFRGELGAKLESIKISEPDSSGFHELTFCAEDRSFIHIIGDNNIVELLEKALQKYKAEVNE